MPRERIYVDLDLDFVAHPNTGDVSRIVNANAVIRAFRNLVFTRYYDAPFQPVKGNWVAGALFENDDIYTRYQIESEILNMAQNFEPRVSDVSVEVNTNTVNAYTVDITFKIVSIIDPVTFTIILERTR